MSFFKPDEFYPVFRRFWQAIRRPALRQEQQSGQQRATKRSPASMFAWCADQQNGVAPIFRFLRIQRKMKRKTLQLTRKFELNEKPYNEPKNHSPGWFLIRLLLGK